MTKLLYPLTLAKIDDVLRLKGHENLQITIKNISNESLEMTISDESRNILRKKYQFNKGVPKYLQLGNISYIFEYMIKKQRYLSVIPCPL